MDISWGGSSMPMFPRITQISKVDFSGGRKTWGASAKPSEKGQQTTTNTTYKCRNVTQALAVGGVCRSCTCSLGNPSSTYKIWTVTVLTICRSENIIDEYIYITSGIKCKITTETRKICIRHQDFVIFSSTDCQVLHYFHMHCGQQPHVGFHQQLQKVNF